jgi:hypothetical protein
MATSDLGKKESRRWVVSSGYWSGTEERGEIKLEKRANRSPFLDRLVFSALVPYMQIWWDGHLHMGFYLIQNIKKIRNFNYC